MTFSGFSEPFIRRPVGTTLLAVGLLLVGAVAYFFLPVASKLKVAIARQTESREMVIEGMISIAQGENPRAIESKLQGYLH